VNDDIASFLFADWSRERLFVVAPQKGQLSAITATNWNRYLQKVKGAQDEWPSS
jgi:hypothetical protein